MIGPATRCSFARRELYIGNTSPDMTDMVLKDFLSNTMQKVWSKRSRDQTITQLANMSFDEILDFAFDGAFFNVNTYVINITQL